MSKAEEKTIELMKKAKDFIPDGGYSEKELNLAFFMFINGYHQAEKDLELTWEDIAGILDVTDIIANDDSMEERLKTMSEEEYCQEVLKRFKDFKERKDGSKR